MTNLNSNPFEKVTITTIDLIKATGGLALELFKLHLLSPVSDHFNSGGAPMLDRLMTEDISGAGIPIETQMTLDYYTLEP
jgi:hypothetical protein